MIFGQAVIDDLSQVGYKLSHDKDQRALLGGSRCCPRLLVGNGRRGESQRYTDLHGFCCGNEKWKPTKKSVRVVGLCCAAVWMGISERLEFNQRVAFKGGHCVN